MSKSIEETATHVVYEVDENELQGMFIDLILTAASFLNQKIDQLIESKQITPDEEICSIKQLVSTMQEEFMVIKSSFEKAKTKYLN